MPVPFVILDLSPPGSRLVHEGCPRPAALPPVDADPGLIATVMLREMARFERRNRSCGSGFQLAFRAGAEDGLLWPRAVDHAMAKRIAGAWAILETDGSRTFGRFHPVSWVRLIERRRRTPWDRHFVLPALGDPDAPVPVIETGRPPLRVVRGSRIPDRRAAPRQRTARVRAPANTAACSGATSSP